MGKHAYCIIAHNDKYCLKTLLSLLDDQRNDIFLLIDKKSSDLYSYFTPPNCNNYLKYSKLHVLDKERIDIRWGDISLMKAELNLFKAVINSEKNYDYIHLISGVDLPIKSQDYIHNFFDKVPPGSNFVGFGTDRLNIQICKYRTGYYHLFLKYQKTTSQTINRIRRILNSSFIRFQKIIGFKRQWGEIIPQKGTNWVSISYEFATYLCKKEKEIIKKYKHITCVDEIYKQTEIFNSKYKDTIYNPNLNAACGTRKIDWSTGRPKIWDNYDFEVLKNSKELFARKFSSSKDKEIIDRIKEFINTINIKK